MYRHTVKFYTEDARTFWKGALVSRPSSVCPVASLLKPPLASCAWLGMNIFGARGGIDGSPFHPKSLGWPSCPWGGPHE